MKYFAHNPPAFPTVLLFLLILPFYNCSCKKDELKEDKFTTILVKKKWKIVSMTTYEHTTTSYSNSFILNDSCERDDIYLFEGNRSLAIDNHLLKCNPGEPSIFYKTWGYDVATRKFSFDSQHIQISMGTIFNDTDSSFTTKEDYKIFGYSYSTITTFVEY